MATAIHTSAVGHGIFDRLNTLWADFKETRRRNAIYRNTVSELNALSTRELHDLGIGRSEIRGLAMEAAYGA